MEFCIGQAKERGYKNGWIAYQAAEYAESLEDFQLIAAACNYKAGWARHNWQERLTNV